MPKPVVFRHRTGASQRARPPVHQLHFERLGARPRRSSALVRGDVATWVFFITQRVALAAAFDALHRDHVLVVALAEEQDALPDAAGDPNGRLPGLRVDPARLYPDQLPL